jgi:TRAP-type C4-dicarboxylate transport system permease large subunit
MGFAEIGILLFIATVCLLMIIAFRHGYKDGEWKPWEMVLKILLILNPFKK